MLQHRCDTSVRVTIAKPVNATKRRRSERRQTACGNRFAGVSSPQSISNQRDPARQNLSPCSAVRAGWHAGRFSASAIF